MGTASHPVLLRVQAFLYVSQWEEQWSPVAVQNNISGIAEPFLFQRKICREENFFQHTGWNVAFLPFSVQIRISDSAKSVWYIFHQNSVLNKLQEENL